MDQSLEEWRPVVGYEGLYEVSSLGRVKSLPRFCLTKGGGARSVPGRILRQCPRPNGYLAVPLGSGRGKAKTTAVAGIVAEAFLGPRPDGYLVTHGEKGKRCNHASNLSYKTPEGNMADKLRDGTHHRGERNARCRLTERQVRFARKAARRGHASIVVLAQAWGVHISTMRQAVEGSSWFWLDA
jgi:hypothetical protein